MSKTTHANQHNLPSQLADNVKGNVAAAKTKVEQIARGIDIGEKGTLGDLIFGPDQVSVTFELEIPLNFSPLVCFSNLSSNWDCLRRCKVTNPIGPFMFSYTCCHRLHLWKYEHCAFVWQAAAKKAAEEAAAKKAAAEEKAKKAAAEKAKIEAER